MSEVEELTVVIAAPREYLVPGGWPEGVASAAEQAYDTVLEMCTDRGRMPLGEMRCSVSYDSSIVDGAGRVLVSAFQDDLALLYFTIDTVET